MKRRSSSLLGLLGLACLVLGSPTFAGPDDPKTVVDFARDVRPILVKNCYSCHGPQKHKAGLRLDRKAEALAGGDSGAVIEPTNALESPLIDRITSDDPTTAMPPKGDRLTPDQVALLRSWIDQGASWPDGLDSQTDGLTSTHWAFQPIKRFHVPEVKDRAWVRNPIDSFILRKLESEGVAPSPEADRPTLIRRLSLDLLGLPPSPEEVQAFLTDQADNAYETLVDRLLASPHFGERWGRHWLDLARYADSDGYEKDSPRPFAWRYRNWVIDAINRDLPFDQFTIDQLAGDLLPDPTLNQRIATGFHRNTLTNREGGVDQEEFRVAAVIDRVNTTSTVWLGLTVACAQCHTHKFDPLLQKEYYGLYAFFNNADEADLSAPLPGEAEAYETAKVAFDAEHAKVSALLLAYDRDRQPRIQTDWEKNTPKSGSRWMPMEPVEARSASGAVLTIKPDRSVLASGLNPESDTYTIKLRTDATGITALRLEALDDPTLPAKGPGRVKHGNFVLNEVSVTAEPIDEHVDNDHPLITFSRTSADHEQTGFPASSAIDGDPATGWAIAGQFGRRHVIVFETEDDFGFAGGTELTIRLSQNHGLQHTIGRLRVSATTAARPVQATDTPEDVLEILGLSPGDRTSAQAARLAEYHRSIDPEYQRLNAPVLAHLKKAPAPPALKAPTLIEAPTPRTTHLLVRGDFLRPGETIQAHTPAVLPPLKVAGKAPNRLDLARWLFDPANPLTARVTVNRIWRDLFGRALVASVDDFGTRGESPSHPELLDWLATEFPAQGWSRKALVRLIVTSAAYRQSSRGRPELIDRDPNNTWLARQNRFRPEAEVVRDLALSAAGLLAEAIGGPSVRPPQPAGISELTYANSARWVESQGADRYRRGLYTWFQRTSPYPMLLTFDAPDSNLCTAKRERSNTPLQALTLLNDAVFVECARGLGRRIIQESPSANPVDRVRLAVRIGLAREPSPEEIDVFIDLYHHALEQCRARPDDAETLVGSYHTSKSNLSESAAWVVLARTLLNLDEFVTRE
ncbi:MAG: PSD1 and planctomycete cytochrome C domain-containing protein [Isosphaeraceae bacterium]